MCLCVCLSVCLSLSLSRPLSLSTSRSLSLSLSAPQLLNRKKRYNLLALPQGAVVSPDGVFVMFDKGHDQVAKTHVAHERASPDDEGCPLALLQNVH